MPKEWDGVISQIINRKFSRPTARFLANRTKATPNQITILSFLVGLASGLLFYNHVLIGGLLAQTSSILDGVDGDLAIFTVASFRVSTTCSSGQCLYQCLLCILPSSQAP